MEYAPIVVFVYDRLNHFKKCIEALKNCKGATESELWVVSDASSCVEHDDKVSKVREYAKSISGFKKVNLKFREQNLGASKSINTAIDEIIRSYGTIIFLEDDNVVSYRFLEFMNRCLEVYKDRKDIFSIGGHSRDFLSEEYPEDIFMLRIFCPWGCAMWKDRWVEAYEKLANPVDISILEDKKLLKRLKKEHKSFISTLWEDSAGRINALDARAGLYMIQNNIATIYPKISLLKNIGHDGSGLHSGVSTKYAKQQVWDKRGEFDIKKDVTYNKIVLEISNKYFNDWTKYYFKSFLYKTGILFSVLDKIREYKRKRYKRENMRM